MADITAAKAKKLVAGKLQELGLTYTKLVARTTSFTDLARGSKLFVTVHGCNPNRAWTQLTELAKQNGFCVINNSAVG